MDFILTLAGALGILFCIIYKPNFVKILKWLAGIAGVLVVFGLITLLNSWLFVIACACFGMALASFGLAISLLHD